MSSDRRFEWPNQSAASNRRPAGQSCGSDKLFATVAAARAFPAAVVELGRWASKSMRLSITTLFLSVLLSIISAGCSHAESLVGVWRTDPAQWENPTGHTNKVEGFYRIEFLKDGAFKFGQFIKGVGGQELPMPLAFGGKYQVVDTSHLKLEASKSPATPSGGKPITVSYSISGDTLDLQGLSDITKTTKYHRVKQ